ncbi:MAG: transcriptional regulator [Pusillimonas sp.]|nr:transcriptional regulator [Pusillimonas sp.]MBC42138.1 transcriptional regulator [Pusillimonas sp.]HCP77229.1 transcriptional regulator [Pusillimonas sp.]|tara:strand:- start:17353 stop:17874 length:522 start_codon:yes stop_codon:yes gene_type:complete
MKPKDTSHNAAADPASHDPFIKLYDMPGYLLRRGGQFINATFDAEMGKMGLTASQLAAFLAVSIQEGMEQRELAARLNWDEATVGGMVRRLEAQGYFERRSSPKSKRGLQIYMTPKGRELYQQAEPHVTRIQVNVLKNLAPDEQKTLLCLLSKMMGENNSYYQKDAPQNNKGA